MGVYAIDYLLKHVEHTDPRVDLIIQKMIQSDLQEFKVQNKWHCFKDMNFATGISRLLTTLKHLYVKDILHTRTGNEPFEYLLTCASNHAPAVKVHWKIFIENCDSFLTETFQRIIRNQSCLYQVDFVCHDYCSDLLMKLWDDLVASQSIHEVVLRKTWRRSDFTFGFIFRVKKPASPSFIPVLKLDSDIFVRFPWTKPYFIGSSVFAKRVEIYLKITYGRFPEWLYEFPTAFLWESGEQTSLGIYDHSSRKEKKLIWEGLEIAKAKANDLTSNELLHLLQTIQANDHIDRASLWDSAQCEDERQVGRDTVKLCEDLTFEFLFLVLQANPNFISGGIGEPPVAGQPTAPIDGGSHSHSATANELVHSNKEQRNNES